MIEVGLVGGVDGKSGCVRARMVAVSWNSFDSWSAMEADDQQGEDQKGHPEVDGRLAHYHDQTNLSFLDPARIAWI